MKKTKPVLQVHTGRKADHEVMLVRKIIEGRLSGEEFCQQVRPKGQLRAVDQSTAMTKVALNVKDT